MASIRENIMTSDSARDEFLNGLVELDQEMSGISAQDAYNFIQNNGIPLAMEGIEQPLSTYDLFVLWHIVAMSIPMPPGNGAHSGPVFLPWHRLFLIRLEQELQRVLGNDDFGLPYWDWAADGELPQENQWQTALWNAEYIGNARGDVRIGNLGNMQVRLEQDRSTGILRSINPRPIFREAGLRPGDRLLPRQADVQSALNESEYDRPFWSQSTISHRNRLEGWIDGPQLHNLVHVWIGGDMSPGTSPNDPAFFLNHCNVDRIWEAWMATSGRIYRPQAGEGTAGHRINDLMISLLGDAMRPADVLNPGAWYAYDTLTVA